MYCSGTGGALGGTPKEYRIRRGIAPDVEDNFYVQGTESSGGDALGGHTRSHPEHDG